MTCLRSFLKPGRQTRESERGVALLLTLGVLSLLLILAMSFAYQARTERMAAAVGADVTKSRLLCESGLERVLAFLYHRYNFPTSFDAADLYPATKDWFDGTAPGSWDARHYAVGFQTSDQDTNFLQQGLATSIGSSSQPFVPDADPTQLTANASWQHIKNSDGNLIGRVGFIIIDESGKLDPAGVVTPEHEPYHDADGDGTRDPNEHFYDINQNGTYDNGPLAEAPADNIRSGGSPEEIRISDEFRTKMAAQAKTWFGWQHIINAGITGFTPGLFQGLFPKSYDIEAWWEDDNGNGGWDQGEDKHRFNLYDPPGGWTGATPVSVSDLTGGTGSTSAFWDTSTDPWSIQASNTNAVPWLADMEDDAGNPVSEQVAANLIDYCDSEMPVEATSDFDYTNPKEPTATYVGCEKAPYINELGVQISFVDTTGAGSPRNYVLTITLDVELINIYDIAFNYDLEAVVDFGGIPNAPTTVGDGSPANSKTDITFTRNGQAIAANDYDVVEFTRTYQWSGPPGDGAFTFSIADARIHLPVGAGECQDFALVTDTAHSSAITAGNLVANYYYTTFEVEDPRANTEATDWTAGAFKNGDDTMITMDLLAAPVAGQVNSNSDPSTGDDAETVTDPAAGLSTAYIRNAPPESLWELGAIHRGEAWRTLNLKAFNDGSSPGIYANGDAAILEQVKLNGETEVRGRINANTPVEPVWSALINEVTIGGAYDNPGSGTAVDGAASPTISVATPAVSRGGVATINTLKNSSLVDGGGSTIAQDTDRRQEEVIGKLANLLTARQNYFSVVVVGQAMQDTGTTDPDGAGNDTFFSYRFDGTNYHYCRILAEQKILATVYRDAYSNRFQVQRYEFLQE